MEKNKKIIIGIIVILLICIGMFLLGYFIKNKTQDDNNFINNYTNVDKENDIAYQNTANIEEIKKETGILGDESIYEINTEYDGRKILNVKHEIQYKVALAGLLLDQMPEYEKIDDILKQYEIKKNGIWVEDKTRNQFLEQLKEITQSEYEISNDGYLNIKNKEKQNEYDRKIERVINGDKQYILSIKDKYYQVDTVTGEIVEYPYEQLDWNQIYDTLEDQNSILYFITTNQNKKLQSNEIMQKIINSMQ